jgi:hypothetical protein
MEESQASEFFQLNATTKGLEGWSIPNKLEALTRLSTMKSMCFGLLTGKLIIRNLSDIIEV